MGAVAVAAVMTVLILSDVACEKGRKTAMLTAGGIAGSEFFPDTLESRKIPGLYAAGEMLDVTGPCGGFNITWALASGMTAGR